MQAASLAQLSSSQESVVDSKGDSTKGINRRLVVPFDPKLITSFNARVSHPSADDCWNWKACQRNGYGAIKFQKAVYSAHVLAWVFANKQQVPEGMLICHKCDNKICCNPSHLELGTPGKNNRDARGRSTFHLCRGELAPNAVLSESDVRAIVARRIETGHGARRLSAELNFSESRVKDILQGRSWVHVTGGPASNWTAATNASLGLLPEVAQ